NSKSLRRLAADHSNLHTAGLPPNFLWPPSNSSNSSCCDDLTSLSVLLAGPEGTPFSSGVFTLTLSIPPTYPSAPPTATFKTKIFHPNVDPGTGSVCVDTLKRDWKSDLRLRDILVVISCLLISPNPASALNAEAGRLCEGDFAAFEKRARTLVNIHARCSRDLASAVE
ncbi:UBC-like protein, partial [Rhizodiscina lignyota]